MAAAHDFTDISKVLIMVQEAQDSERDQREHVKEAKRFITDRDGQWDQDAINKMDGRYRGTFDMLTPIVDGIAGEIDQADFTLRVSPSGGRASEDTADTLDGVIRNIRNISNAEDIFNKAARSNVIGGFDAWEVVQAFIEGDSFDQDLLIKKVSNAADSVWFDLASVEQDRSDAKWAVKLVAVPVADYKARWPDGGGMSVGDQSRREFIHNDTKESIVVGQLYYKKPTKIELVRMTDGTVYRDDEDFAKTKDELEAQGITVELDDKGEEKRRSRDNWRVWSRMFDGAEWLKPEEKTVFDFIPIIPIYGNFDIVDNQTVYFGKLEKLLDPQRGYNYAQSRDIEDGAFSPPATIWMTDAQADGNDYSTMNTDRDPIRIYNHDPNVSPPVQTLGPQASSGLQTTMANMQQMITVSSNTFNSQRGNANPNQSGIAGQQQIEQGNIGSIKWFKSLEVAICYTGKVLINAIPRVYDSTRQVRVLGEDGASKIVPLNKTVFDDESQQNIVLNDLSIGEYDVVCDVGPAFNSAQKEAARSFEIVASINPEVAQRNMDIWLKNRKEPGMDLMAERERVQLFQAGQIPESQWTDEEKQQVQEAQQQAQGQEQHPDPLLLAAQAEMVKGRADQTNADNKTLEIQGRFQLENGKLELDNRKIDLDIAKFNWENEDKFNVDAAKIDQGQQKIDNDADKNAITAQQNQNKIDLQAREQLLKEDQQEFNNVRELQKAQQEEFAAAVTALQGVISATGADVVMGPHLGEAIVNQAVQVTELQEEQGNTDIGRAVAGTVEVSIGPDIPDNQEQPELGDE